MTARTRLRALVALLPLFTLALFTAVRPTSASVMLLSMDDMVSRSHAVVRVEVLETSSAWGEWIHGGEVIYTTARVRVSEVFLGAPPAELDITVLGGTVDGKTMFVSDCPTLSPGEDAVLFLLEYEGRHWITGLDNGKYVVESGTAVNAGHQTGRRLSLSSLRGEVRDAAIRLGRDR